MDAGIYLITCQRGNKLPVYYVGQSVSIKNRIQQHKRLLKKGCHNNGRLQNSWVKYGEHAFSFLSLEFVDRTNLNCAEQWWLDQMCSHSRCLNLALTPHGGASSGESHYAFGRQLTNEHRAAIAAGGRGLKRSKETKSAISAANLGPRNSMFGMVGIAHKKSKPIQATDAVSGISIEFASACLAELAGYQQAAISRCCNGKQRIHKGQFWSFI